MAFLKSWFGSRSNSSVRRRSVDRRLILEALEDRSVPCATAPLQVANPGSSGAEHLPAIQAELNTTNAGATASHDDSVKAAGPVAATHSNNPTPSTFMGPLVRAKSTAPAPIAPTKVNSLPAGFMGPVVRGTLNTPAPNVSSTIPPAPPSQPTSPAPNSGFGDFGGSGMVFSGGSQTFIGGSGIIDSYTGLYNGASTLFLGGTTLF